MLVAPYIFIGPYGVTLSDGIVVLAFFAFVLTSAAKGELSLPRMLWIYLALFGFGWAGAIVNGANWEVPIGLWELNFFYKVALAIGGFHIGYRYYEKMDTIVKNRFFSVVIIGLGALAVVYPFLNYDQRFGLLKIFFAPWEVAEGIDILTSPRFPGLGINANIYSFMVFIFLLFMFDAYVRKQISGMLPLAAFIVILVGASKLVIGLAVTFCLLILTNKLVSFSAAKTGAAMHFALSKRALWIIFVLTLFFLGSIFYLTQTSTGKAIIGTVETVTRIQAAIEGAEGVSSFAFRFDAWNRGLERVALAPVFGISRHRYPGNELTPLLFNNPHNEFISFWMIYGLVGMFAHIYLLGTVIIANLRQNGGLVWLMFYLALIIYMMFDGAFEYVRFQAMFFFLVGTNMQYLRRKRATHPGYQMNKIDDPATV